MTNAVLLTRNAYTRWGTFGLLTVGDWECATCERPWLDNAPSLSCIPIGVYPLRTAIHYGGDGVGGAHADYACYSIEAVPNRSLIHIHVANHAGQLAGCVAVGGPVQWFPRWQSLGVPNSRATFIRFMDQMAGRDGVITIQNTRQGEWTPSR
jgi:hypothetical protein